MYKQPKPILRQAIFVELQSDINKLVLKANIYQNCLNCQHWNIHKDECGLFNSKPPTEILIYSCPEYKDDDNIPF